MRILTVSSDRENNSHLARLLEAEGYTDSLEQASLEQAQIYFGANRVDLLLMEISSQNPLGEPEFDRFIEKFSTLPVIILADKTTENQARAALQHGAQDYLLKDQLTAPMLARVIKYATEQKRNEEQAFYNEQLLDRFFSQGIDGFFFMMLDDPIQWDDRADKKALLDYVFDHQHITRVNQALVNQYAATQEQLIGLTPTGLFKGNLTFARQFWFEFFDKGQMHAELTIRRFDDTLARIECDYRCFYDREGRITGHFGVQKDITDKHRSEELAHAAEERYRRVIEDQTELICRYDREYRLTFVNAAYCEMYGETPEKLLGETFFNKIPEKDQELARRYLAGITPENPVATSEHRTTMPDGSERWIQWTDRALLDSDGNIVEYQGVGRDITDRKQAESNLRDSEERYRAVSELISDYAYSFKIGPDNSIELEWLTENSFTRLTGYTLEDIKKKGIFSIFHPADLEALKAEYRLMFQGITSENDFRIITKSGETRWIQHSRLPFWDADHKRIIRFYGTAKDITERKLNEEALRRSEERFYKAFASSPDPTLITRLRDGRIIEVNDRFTEFSGYSRQELIGYNVVEINFWADENDRNRFVEQIISESSVRDLDLVLRIKSGKLCSTQLSAEIIQLDGENCLLSTIKDITERKEIEEALAASEAQYRSLVESSDSMIAMLDKEGRYLYVNENTANRFGFATNYMVGKTIGQLFGEKVAEPQMQNLKYVLQNNTGLIGETPIAFGEERLWFRYSIQPVRDSAGQPWAVLVNNTNITDTKRAEQALVESEERYRLLTELMSDYVYSLKVTPDESLELEWVSEQSFTRLTGYTREDCLSNGLVFLYHPEDQARIKQDMQQVLRGEQNSGEYRIITKSGETVWVNITRRPVWDLKNNRVIKFYGMVKDISSRKQWEAALRRSEEKYAKAFASSPDAILITRPSDSYLIEVNDKLCDFTGYSREELVGQPTVGTQLWANLEDRDKALSIIAEKGFVHDFESAYRTKSGEIRQMLLSAEKVELEENNYLLVTLRDVNEQKKIERALRRSEEKYAKAFASSPDAIAITRLRDGKYIELNDKFCYYTGYAREELIGTTSLELNVWAYPEERKELANILQAEGAVRNFEASYRTKSGEIRQALCAAEWFELEEEKCLLMTVRDITEQKKIEKALRLSEERYRQINELMSDFAFSLVMVDGTLQLEWITEQSFTRLTGYTLQELNEQGLFFLYDPSESDKLERELQNSITGHISNQFDLKMHTRDGDTRWLRIVREVIWNEDHSHITKLYGTAKDVTEQKQSEEAMRRSEEKFSKAFAISPDSIVISTLDDGRYIEVNDRLVELTGYSREELLGFTSAERNIWANSKDRELLVTALKKDGSVRDMEFLNWRKNGELVSVLISAEIIELDGQQCMLATVRNITERKRIEEALRESEEKYRSLVESSDSMIAMVDWKGQFLFANEAEARRFKTNPEALKWKSIETVYPPRTAEQFLDYVRKVIRSGSGLVVEAPYEIGRDTRWFRTSVQPVRGGDGQPIAAIINSYDITEFKRAEEALRESEASYRRIVETAQEGIVVLDVDTNISYTNQKLADMLGYSISELLRKPMFSFVLEEEQPKAVECIEQCRQGRQKQQDFRFVRRDEAVIWVHISTTPIIDEQGKFRGGLAMVSDITDRKRAEEGLKRAADRLEGLHLIDREILAASTAEEIAASALKHIDGLLVYKQAGVLVFNHEDFPYETLWVHQSQRQRQASILEFSPEKLRMDIQEQYRLVDLTGPQDELVTLYRRLFPEQAKMILHVPLPRQGQIIGIFCLVVEETDQYLSEYVQVAVEVADQLAIALHQAHLNLQIRHQSLELERRVMERTTELDQAKKRLEAIFDSSSDGIMLLDRMQIIQQINPAVNKLLSADESYCLGRSLKALTHPDDGTLVEIAAEEVFMSGEVQQIEIRLLQKTGQIVDAELSIAQLTLLEGDKPGLVCSLRDISERKRAEEALRRTLAKEKELGELKSRFVSMASHEFRTPLATIGVTAETLYTYRERMDTKQIDQRLTKIIDQVAHLKNIIEDVLQVTRIQEGLARFEPVKIDLVEFCQEIVEDFQNQPDLNHRLLFDHSDPAITADIDKKLMRQIISNLISNALKYSPAQSAIYLYLAGTGNTVTMTIRDEGIGIPQSDLPHLFEPFHRAANAEVIPGTGLGLTITKQALDLHGGSIFVDSQVGVGTTFTIVFPVDSSTIQRALKS